MKVFRRIRVAYLGAALLPLLSPATQAQVPLQVAQRPRLQDQAEAIVGAAPRGWGILAWSVTRNQPLIAINANEPLVPASNNKVFSAIYALTTMGPNYRFPTDLLLGGPVQNGVLRGPVVIRGTGDPAFGYPEFTKPEPMLPLQIMARQLKARGIRVIEGGVLGDAAAFDSLYLGPEWPLDTQGGASYYAPRVSGLSYQRNMLAVELTPGGGGRPTVELHPAVQELIPVTITARNGGGRAWATRRPESDTVQVKGSVGRRGVYMVGVTDPPLLTAGALRAALQAEGIEVRGPVRLGRTPEGARLFHRHWSMTLGEMTPKLNRDSDNFFAEHFFKAAVRRSLGQGRYGPEASAASAEFFRARAQVPEGQVFQADGSGLSALNRTTAFALVRALMYAHRQPWSQLFHQSLAVAGDPNGSMKRMFRGTRAEKNLHAKTGYIKGVRTLSGFVTARNGELIVFSLLYNGRNTSGARGVQQQIGELLASYGG